MRALKLSELPDQELPRERLEKLGAAALSDSELIAILLRTGQVGCNVLDLAKQLLAKHHSLEALARCNVNELKKVPGIKQAKAVQLAAAFELGNRLAREQVSRQRMDRPDLVYDLLASEMRSLTRESLRVLLLNTKHALLRVHEVSIGTLSETLAHPREILQPVLSHGAFAFILVHNHPSGDPHPSEADRRLTIRIQEAARLMQVPMLDHVIIGSEAPGRSPYFSFREAGLV